MKAPEEIKKALEMCVSEKCATEEYRCQYLAKEHFCIDSIMSDALACIDQLKERIDLMLIQMHGDCGCCAYKGRPSYKSPCTECLCGENRPMWEYEGLPELTKETKYEQNERGQAD